MSFPNMISVIIDINQQPQKPKDWPEISSKFISASLGTIDTKLINKVYFCKAFYCTDKIIDLWFFTNQGFSLYINSTSSRIGGTINSLQNYAINYKDAWELGWNSLIIELDIPDPTNITINNSSNITLGNSNLNYVGMFIIGYDKFKKIIFQGDNTWNYTFSKNISDIMNYILTSSEQKYNSLLNNEQKNNSLLNNKQLDNIPITKTKVNDSQDNTSSNSLTIFIIIIFIFMLLCSSSSGLYYFYIKRSDNNNSSINSDNISS